MNEYFGAILVGLAIAVPGLWLTFKTYLRAIRQDRQVDEADHDQYILGLLRLHVEALQRDNDVLRRRVDALEAQVREA